MLSFLHRLNFCWKCEFHADVKKENYYHHDEEQLGFYKKVRIKTQSKKKDVLVILQSKNSNFLTKTVLKRTLNAKFSMKKIDLDES